MRALVFHEHGDVSNLRIEDFPNPKPGPADALIRVRAASLNGFDPMILAGTTGLKTPLPMIPCGDYAGEIVELGAEVDGDWKPGDRVCPHPFVFGEGMTGETRLGAACELARIPAANLLRVPNGVSYAQAASLPIAYGTAHRMMVTRGQVKAGEKVLILGATGGVGTCCVQLAKAAGAEVAVCGSAAWKLTKLADLGADHLIDTSKVDFVEAVHKAFGKPRMLAGGGVDVVVNYVGGDTWARGLRCLGTHGRMLTCGASAGYDPQTDIRFLWTYEQQVIGSNGWTLDDQRTVLEKVAAGELEPVLHAVRPLEQGPESIQELIERRVVGKTILTID